MSGILSGLKKFKEGAHDPAEQDRFCCVYGSVDRPRCEVIQSHVAQAEMDCAYLAVKEGFAESAIQIESCPLVCEK